ncbi:MAG: polyprenyl synthetase family protein [Gemmatimonadaceae bacterium]
MTTARARIVGEVQRIGAYELTELTPDVGRAVRYALSGEGKCLRGLLVTCTYQACNGTGDPTPLAAAVEVVHAYSLVHDDLPCMDDDDLRRGQPTVHRAMGVSAATAAGLTMVPLAARVAFRAARTLGLAPDTCGDIVRELMRASGAGGMIGGQLLDLEAEGRQLSLSELERVHRAKTGALIASAVRIGALAAGAQAPRIDALSAFGDALGLAFQIADDVLDLTATSAQLGKTAGRDVALQKSTYPGVMGVEGAMSRASALAQEACRYLDTAGVRTPELESLARYVVERQS